MNVALKDWFAGGPAPAVAAKPYAHQVVRFHLSRGVSVSGFGHLACAQDSARRLASAGLSAIVTSAGHLPDEPSPGPSGRALRQACTCRWAASEEEAA